MTPIQSLTEQASKDKKEENMGTSVKGEPVNAPESNSSVQDRVNIEGQDPSLSKKSQIKSNRIVTDVWIPAHKVSTPSCLNKQPDLECQTYRKNIFYCKSKFKTMYSINPI